MASLGVDFIKFRTVASPETYQAIAEESKAKGLMFVGHQFGAPEAMIDAGQKSIEHYSYPPINSESEHAERFIRRWRQLVFTLCRPWSWRCTTRFWFPTMKQTRRFLKIERSKLFSRKYLTVRI